MSVEIICAACGADTLIRREPVYEGFKKTGQKLSCAACGHEYASEEDVPFKGRSTSSIFGEEDRPRRPEVFAEEDRSRRPEVFAAAERGRNCRHCRHYLLNPFTQRCGLHQKEVRATDVCDDFAPPGIDPSESDAPVE